MAEVKEEKWNGKATKMSRIDKSQIISIDSSKEEVERIIPATYTEAYPPKIFLHGYEFIMKSNA